MEYTFQNEIGKPIHVEIHEFHLVVRIDETERSIPYSAITDVRLGRRRNIFALEVLSIDFGSLRISHEHLGTTDGKIQSRQYSSFVRILHYHLIKNKSAPEFYSGPKTGNITLKFIFILIFAALAYLIEGYFSFVPLDPLFFSLLILGIGSLALASPYLVNWPKNYHPSNIPLNMLPPET
jgi:hypothetical protein